MNVSSQFSLFNGFSLGGDQAASGPLPRAELRLGAGARVRVGDDPTRPDLPLLAIGSFGSVVLNAAGSAYIGDPLDIASYENGSIRLAPGGHVYGNGTISGIGFSTGDHLNIRNIGGNLNPGFSPGRLTIEDEYIQESGELELEIGGANPGEYDVLDATEGARFLGGTIRFVLLNGFAGSNGTTFDYFAGRGIDYFDPSVSILDETGLGLDFDITTGKATITTGVVVPIPSAVALLASACAGLYSIGWRRKHRPALT